MAFVLGDSWAQVSSAGEMEISTALDLETSIQTVVCFWGGIMPRLAKKLKCQDLVTKGSYKVQFTQPCKNPIDQLPDQQSTAKKTEIEKNPIE